MLDTDTSRLAFLQVPGEMARLMREKDWAQTPFGPVETWSTALRSAVSICLGSRFPIVLYWGPTRALIYNDAWSPVPGQKHPWALGRPGPEVWSEIWDIIGPMFDQVMERGEATWSEDQLLPLNRFGYVEECYFYYSYSPVRGEDGTVEGIFTAVTETTQRVLSERRERLLREVSEATSQTRTAREACAAAVSTLARMPEEVPFCLAYLRGQAGEYELVTACGIQTSDDLAPARIDPRDNQTPWPVAEMLRAGATASVSGLAGRFDRRLPSAPWPEPVEEAVVVPIQGARPDAPHGFLVVGISPRRRIDADYRTLLERAAAHVATAIVNAEAYEAERLRAEQLAELDRAKTAFFSNASHEFRTPLTLMLGPVEDMLERIDAPDGRLPVARGEVELVQRNGQRLLRLVNALLDFSRIEAGRVQASFEPVDLAAYTSELARSFETAMNRAGLSYRIDCPPLSRPVSIDREMWEKIVLNLVSNAFKYTLEGGVAVRLRETAEGAHLEVEDSGVGIPEAERARVFERFHRVEGQVGRTHEGTGIGLALVKDLVVLHGGEVAVTDRPGGGSVFLVTLPFGTERAAAAKPERPAASTATRAETFVAEALRWLPGVDEVANDPRSDAPAAPECGRGEHILLAEDNADMRGYVERLLSQAGYVVEAVENGRRAVEAATAAKPSLLLSDVMMPRLDGFGVIRELRADARTADLPIILLSARAGEEASVEGLEAGADDYLVKPFSARELLARVEGALRLSAARRETADRLSEANEALERKVTERTRERDRMWAVSQDLIGVADAAGIWLSVNPAWTRVLGWEADEIVGRTSQWMEHPDDVAKTRSEIGDLAAGRTTYDFENRFRSKDGSYRTLSWTAVPEDGLLYCVARDVTEQRHMEEALRQSQKMEAVGQLTGGLAHDFNNLLAGISGSLELMQARIAQGRVADVDRYLVAAQGASKRAAALTHRLLAFSRRQTLEPKPTAINALIMGMEELIRRTVGPSVEVESVAGGGIWNVLVDPNQLENALLNLCINARDAMPDGGRITIETANRWLDDRASRERDLPPGQYVSMCVSDNGVGMSREVVEKAFDPFFTTKPIGVGTGLGLSMIYGFARQSGGQVRIYSEVGQGTMVCIYLPRHIGEAEVETQPPGGELGKAGAGETVLVIDDEPLVRMLVVDVLEELGYTAIEAGDGPSGMKVLRSDAAIDLLVTDVGLPNGMNGRQVADAARELRPGLKVLFVTGYAENAVLNHGHLDHGTNVVTKPFNLDELGRKIRDMIGKS
ncbi:ATP-binding protein [Antarcticirhabdus aurantiaca]|uniref:Response regulator n=1 Tax=Antarcticirhabdus aurantiaca TaxID=2606717 RepID=A0ACD4NKE3_9HYPH|nr:ATP-binding protein [Antarcticirhabdus aurantiaca]WAJ27268.1 response regulator [Jeongeuplla avenae]